VFEEVRDGLLSAEKARASYGVAVLPDLTGIDEAETGRLRAAAAA
jgi:N-methylhydantoinase B